MNKKNGTIYIISCGIDVPFPRHRISDTLKKCDILAGSNSLIQQVETDKESVIFTKETVSQTSSLTEAAESGKSILILASGDSLLQGISGTVLRLAKGKSLNVKITPGTTAFQALFSRINIPWKDSRFFSVHSGEPLPSREILASTLPVIYGGNKFTGADIAEKLISFHEESAAREAVLADSLGTDQEQLFRGTLKELSQKEVSPLSMLLLLPPKPAEQIQLQLGSPSDFYQHQMGLITSPEVRAIAISKLKLPYEGVIWDIGAGSGSVGVEIAALVSGVSVHSVEKNASRIDDIFQNIESSGVTNVTVHEGAAEQIVNSLPQPNRIFVGGGGAALIEILESSFDRLKPGGRIVLTAVTVETIQKAANWNTASRTESVTVDISREEQLGNTAYSLYRPENRITIFIWEKNNG